MSSNSEPKSRPRAAGGALRADRGFAESVGRNLTSAADLLARFGRQVPGASGEASSRPGQSVLPPVKRSDGRWDLEGLVTNIAARAAKFVGSDTIDPGADFFDLGGTSMNAVDLVAVLSRELGIEVSLDDLFADARPRRLAELWLGKVGASDLITGSSTAEVAKPPVVRPPMPRAPDGLRSPYADEDARAIEADLELSNALPWVGPPAYQPPRRILLTGATGFLGSHMLFDLLRHGDAHVVCLVRASDDHAAEQRLAHELEVRQLPWSSELQRRVTAVAGDIDKPQLGWDDALWTRMTQEIDSVVHVAAAVDFLRGYQSLRRANVLGALGMATFATTGRVKPLHHISTISVFDELGIRSVGEDDPPAHVDRLFAGYEKTKWAAEALLRRARERGLVVSILRPGGIGGHTVTGVYNPKDLGSGFMAAWYGLRAFPAFRNLHSAPVDWVSRVSAELVLDPDAWGYNYNLTGIPIDLQTVARGMTLSGMNMRIMSFDEWRECFRERMERDPIPHLEFLARIFESPTALKLIEASLSSPKAGTRRTDAFVRRHNLPRPPRFDAQASIAMVERLARDGRLQLPSRSDPAYLRFGETMEGELSPIDGGAHAACSSRLQLSVGSFYQMLRDRRIDVHGQVQCSLLHPEPLQVESGDCWVRPGDGVPERHGNAHPLLQYKILLRAADGRGWWMDGLKLARPGRDLWQQARTLYVELGPQGQPASLRGELVVPPDSYVPEQIDGIEVNPDAPRQEHGMARLIWMAWFGAQLSLGFSEPLLRSFAQLVDAGRGFAQKVERP